MPLVAIAYAAYAAGLIAGYSRFAVASAILFASSAALLAVFSSHVRAASALIALGGALVAVTAPTRVLRDSRDLTSGNEPAGLLQVTKQNASLSIDRLFGDDAPMARALLIADQHRIAPEMRDRYANAGMVHMLSISGLHVAIVAGAVSLILQAMRLPGSAALVLGFLITAVYVAIIGAPPPAVRSAVMLGMVSASRIAQRPTSPWAGLAVGALIPLVNPRTVLDLGYQLSVIGIAGLIASGLLAKRILEPRLDGWRLRLSKELLTSVVATLITAPIIAWYFGRLSIIAPLANLAAGPVISILQPTLFAALATSPVPTVAQFLADAAHPLLLLFDGIATAAAATPGASVAVVPSIVTVIAGAAAVTGMIIACVSKYPARPLIAFGLSAVVIAWSPAFAPPYSGGVEMHVLDVGQGDAILFRSDRGRWVIFDAGRIWKSGDAARSTIIPYVMSRGGDVDAFVLSHAHADHIGGAASLIRALHPRVFWDAAFPQGSAVYQETLGVSRSEHVEWRRVHPGDRAAVDGLEIEFLAPDSAWTASLSDPNEASTIALVKYGAVRFLLVGDAESAEEAWLLHHSRSDLKADVLKVGHHGSSTSSTDKFLAAVNPAVAVISVGADNLYGHPSNDVLASLGRIGARTLRTDQSGTIVLRSDGRRLTVEAAGEKWDSSRR